MKRRLFCICLAGFALGGCNSASTAPLAVSVRGKVVAKKKGVAGVLVKFWPQGEALQNSIKPVQSVSEPDGTFQLMCPAGSYKVTLFLLPPGNSVPAKGEASVTKLPKVMPQGEIRIRDSYRNPSTTDLAVEVTESGKTDLVLQVK